MIFLTTGKEKMADLESKECWYDRCIVLEREGKRQESIDELFKLAEQYPDYSLPHVALAVFLGKEEKFEDSIAQAQIVCDLDPDDPFSYTALSTLAIKAGNREVAEAALMKGQELRLAELFRQQQEDASGRESTNGVPDNGVPDKRE